jgi:hypothetical protein
VAWLYAPGTLPHSEVDSLDLGATGTRAISVRGVVELKRLVQSATPLEGLVLRFGYLYGPDTWYAEPRGEAPLHVGAAAIATALAVTRGPAGAVFARERRTTMSSKLTGPAEVQVSSRCNVFAPDRLPSLAVHSYMKSRRQRQFSSHQLEPRGC